MESRTRDPADRNPGSFVWNPGTVARLPTDFGRRLSFLRRRPIPSHRLTGAADSRPTSYRLPPVRFVSAAIRPETKLPPRTMLDSDADLAPVRRGCSPLRHSSRSVGRSATSRPPRRSFEPRSAFVCPSLPACVSHSAPTFAALPPVISRRPPSVFRSKSGELRWPTTAVERKRGAARPTRPGFCPPSKGAHRRRRASGRPRLEA